MLKCVKHFLIALYTSTLESSPEVPQQVRGGAKTHTEVGWTPERTLARFCSLSRSLIHYQLYSPTASYRHHRKDLTLYEK